MKSFRCTEIAQLMHELTLSPRRHRLRQLSGISRAIELIDPKREYPYSFVCFQITGYRPRRTDDVLLDGKSVIEDLIDLADILTADHPIPAESVKTRLHDAESLASRFKVSVKTISRWRKRGLVGCRYDCHGSGPKLAFSTRAVQSFVTQNLELVRRGSSFKLMRREEKSLIIARARELVATEQRSLHAVTMKLAEETGRAVETIRYTLRRFDQENPAEALFDRTEQANKIDEKEVIYLAFVDGEHVSQLAERFNKPETEIRRLLTAARVEELASNPIDYIHHESFDAPDAASQIMETSGPESREKQSEADPTLTRVPSGLPAYLQELYRTPLLTATEERHLFRKMNFVLHGAEQSRQKIAKKPQAATETDVADVDKQLDRATEIKNQIIQSNLRLVVSIAKRHLSGGAAANLFELVSDGNIALMRAVEKFDYARGFRFSTYASWAIMRSYARSVPEAMTHTDRFRTGHDEVLASTRDYRAVESSVESPQEHLRSTLADSLAELDDRERSIVERHFGLGDADSTRTLDEIGREFGISKERVRQIELRALKKLRNTLGDRGAELLAG